MRQQERNETLCEYESTKGIQTNIKRFGLRHNHRQPNCFHMKYRKNIPKKCGRRKKEATTKRPAKIDAVKNKNNNFIAWKVHFFLLILAKPKFFQADS